MDSARERTRQKLLVEVEQMKKVLQSAEEFLILNQKYRSLLETNIGVSADNGLISEENERLMVKILSADRPALMITGANSSGKSTLVNCLFNQRLAPSGTGHVSKRICRFSSSVDEQSSYIRFARLNAATGTLDPLPNNGPSSYIPLGTMTKQKVVQLLELLLRGSSQDADLSPFFATHLEPLQNSSEYEKWVTTVVEVFYPIPLLQVGIDVYDCPGTSESDVPAVQEMLPLFWSIVRPSALFVYSNPSFGDAELNCLRQLHQSFRIERDQSSSMFFVNTNFDLNVIRSDYAVDEDTVEVPQDVLDKEQAKRYKLLRRCPLIKGLPEDWKECANFACIGLVDLQAAKRSRAAKVEEMFANLTTKLLDFSVQCLKQKMLTAISILLSGTKMFHSDMDQLRSQHISFAREELEGALSSLKRLEGDLIQRINGLVNKLPESIKARCKDVSMRKKARQFAGSVSLEAYDGRSQSVVYTEALGAFKERFCPWIRQEILEPELSFLEHDLSETERSLFEQFTRAEQNLLLSNVINSHFLHLNTKNVTNRSAPVRFSRVLVRATKVIVSRMFSTVKWMTSAFKNIDASFKENAALQMLDFLADDVTLNEDFRNQLTSDSMMLIQELRDDIDHRRKHADRLESFTQMLQDQLFDYRSEFGLLEMKLLAQRSEIFSPPPQIFSDVDLGRGATNQVFQGSWEGMDVAVKTLHKSNDEGALLGFCEEVHFSWVLTAEAPDGCGLKYFPQFLGLYQSDSSPMWRLVVTKYEENLTKYLHTNIQNLTVFTAAEIALQIAQAMKAMHDNGLLHRDIKPDNILVRHINNPPQLEVVLSDFGTSTGNIYPVSLAGTQSYLAPEMLNEDLRRFGYSKAVDVFSFGITLFELLPRKEFKHVFHMNVRDYSSLPFPPNTHPNLKSLVLDCLQQKPESRPTAAQIVQLLCNFLTIK